jgi:hypothetical protein
MFLLFADWIAARLSWVSYIAAGLRQHNKSFHDNSFILRLLYVLILGLLHIERSWLTAHGHFLLLGVSRAGGPTFESHDQISIFLSWYENFLILNLSALSDDRARLLLALQWILGPGCSEPITTLCCPIRGWPSYTNRHFFPFLSPHTTQRNYDIGILARIPRKHNNLHTLLWYVTDLIENYTSKNPCISAWVFTEPLFINDNGITSTDTECEGRDLWSALLNWGRCHCTSDSLCNLWPSVPHFDHGSILRNKTLCGFRTLCSSKLLCRIVAREKRENISRYSVTWFISHIVLSVPLGEYHSSLAGRCLWVISRKFHTY